MNTVSIDFVCERPRAERPSASAVSIECEKPHVPIVSIVRILTMMAHHPLSDDLATIDNNSIVIVAAASCQHQQ